MRITIVGGGNGAFAAAGDLTLRGFECTLLELPEFASNIEPVQQAGGLNVTLLEGLQDIRPGFARVAATTDPETALAGSELVLAIVPSFAHRRVAEFCAPYLRRNQCVVLMPGNLGGSASFGQYLNKYGAPPVRLAETSCMIYACRKAGAAQVLIRGYKKGLCLAALPSSQTDDVMDVITRAYPDMVRADNVLETGLGNVNPYFHPPIALCNAARIESGEKFRFYYEGSTRGVCRIADSLDAERIALGATLGLRLEPMWKVALGWYEHEGAHGKDLYDVHHTVPAYKVSTAPAVLESRYFTEDLPFGLIPIRELGGSFGLTMPLTDAMIHISSALVGRDLSKEARSLREIGWIPATPEQLIRMVS